MPTITRGAVTLTPQVILPARLTRPGSSIVHRIIGDPEPDVTIRDAGLRTGELRTLWPTAAAAEAAAAALAIAGGPWLLEETGDCDMTALVVGDVLLDGAADGANARLVTITVQEIA